MKKKSVINLVFARRLRFSASGACLRALTALLVVFATGFLPVSAQNDATNRPPVQTYYLPIPEEDLLQTLTSIHMRATPPYNTAEIELNDANAHFFKIRVDNLADEVR